MLQSPAALAQKPKPKPPVKKASEVKPELDEKTEFENAVAIPTASERLAALEKFLNDFPESKNKTRAQELIVSARAEIGEEKLRFSETEEGLKMFRLAALEAPKPMSDELYTVVVLQFPTNLFFRGQQAAALEIAKIIEEKVEGNAKQLLGLAAFYIGIENGDEARRLAEKAIAIDPNLPAAYQTLGLAHRLNFDLENSAAAYTKALELDSASTVSRRSLAEMKRAVGKPSEAAELYREILEKSPEDGAAQTGFVLSLFDAGKVSEAETELARSLEANPKNLLLLVGAAYWYAANKNPVKAAEYAQKAVETEPRYTWGYIALARAYLAQNKPAEAEKTLLAARQYGNFPTLDYELATARAAAGFYNEAAQTLRKSFTVTSDGKVRTRLGNRVARESDNFVELLAPERRASIFQPAAADSAESAERLKNLLNFAQKLESNDATESEIAEAADNFVKGADKAKAHRQIFAANSLLQKRTALPKALELVQSAIGGVDEALEVDSPASFVLADELYESRAAAISQGQLVVVPELPRDTLSKIVRGRTEEIAGWSLFYQEKPQDAAVRLKRAVGILPEKSAWWRSSMWRLGATLEAEGKLEEALDAYIRSYTSANPDAARLSVIETLYKRINGTLDGLEQRLEQKPLRASSFLIKQPEKSETVAKAEIPTTAQNEKASVVITDGSVSSRGETAPVPTPAPTPEPANEPEETAPVRTEVSPSPLPETTPTPESSPSPTDEEIAKTEKIEDEAETEIPEIETSPTPETQPAPMPTPEVSTDSDEETPAPEPSPETFAETETSPTVEPTPETTIETINETTNETTDETTPEVEPSPSPEVTPTPESTPEMTPEPSPTPEVKTEPANAPTAENKSSKVAPPRYEVVITENTLPVAGQKRETVVSPTPDPNVVARNETETLPPTVNENNPESPQTEENISQPAAKPEVVITETEPKPAEKPSRPKNMPPNPQSRPKLPFESVVINIPMPEKVSPSIEPIAEKPSEKAAEVIVTETPVVQPEKIEPILLGEERPRVVVTNDLTNKNLPCTLSVSQERVTISSEGGMIGILAGYLNAENDLAKITAVSNRPSDVAVEYDPVNSRLTGRAFFIVKSISSKTGLFTVTFDSPCGEKTIQVRVR